MDTQKNVVPDIKSLYRDEIIYYLEKQNQPRYRADQILNWIYRHYASEWSQMSNLSIELRKKLPEIFKLYTSKLAKVQSAADSTRKFLWQLEDGSFVESVLIPANPALYGESSDRMTLCVSTQVGCAYKCKFCASGLNGFVRNLGAGEIVEQILAAERWAISENLNQNSSAKSRDRIISNIVFMGMGEPFANYDNLLRAIKIINSEWGCNIGARKMTISTCGLAPEIKRFAAENIQVRLAISLHGATNEVRSKLMPINKKYPLEQLIEALRFYKQNKSGMITFEYILIEGVNDSPQDAERLASIAKPLFAKVNLIPYNKVEGLDYKPSPLNIQKQFLNILKRRGVAATLRREKGGDIDAACGQLRLKTESTLKQDLI
ncbi:MAG: 23S rRNA (adenine(2503)-C(2))-methyltransferase RlmN [Verrucomicrobiia bacterium]|jgi:23S rRNA (adenine2503-C2)-methyltransferase